MTGERLVAFDRKLPICPGTALNLRSKFVISQEVLRDIFYNVSVAYSQLAHGLRNIRGSTQCEKNTLIKTKFGFLSMLCQTVSSGKCIHISKYLFYNLLTMWGKVVVTLERTMSK